MQAVISAQAKQKETALGSVTWTLTPRNWRDFAGERVQQILGAPQPQAKPHPKFLKNFLRASSLCRNLNRPVKLKTCDTSDCFQGQVRVPARLMAPLLSQPRARTHSPQVTQGTAPGPQQPRRPGCLLRGHCLPGLRTAAEIKKQKIRRQEGDTLGAIFLLLLEGHPQSPRRRRGRRPRAHGPAHSWVPTQRDDGVFPDTRSPGDRGAAPSGLSHTQLSSTRNPQLLPPPPHPPSVSLAAPPRTGDPRIPGDNASVVSQGGRGSFGLLSSASFSSCQGEDKKSNESRTVHGSRGPRRGSAGQRLGLAPWVSSGGSRGSGWSGGSWSSGGGRGLGQL